MTLEKFVNEQGQYISYLTHKESSSSTIRKYSMAIRKFIEYAEVSGNCDELCKDCFIGYKQHLEKNLKPSTSNLYIVALNGYLKYLGETSLSIKTLRIQPQNILENCVTKDEYKRMLEIAQDQKDNRVYYVMRTLANTGMRVKGVSFLTVDIVKTGYFIVTNKGKTRCIVIPEGICKELLVFCKNNGICDGYIFKGKKSKDTISQSSIRRWLGKIAILANVDVNKAFPHNLRHLFAITYLEKYGNISELADILGHTSIETTRIYTCTGIKEKRDKMEDLDL